MRSSMPGLLNISDAVVRAVQGFVQHKVAAARRHVLAHSLRLLVLCNRRSREFVLWRV